MTTRSQSVPLSPLPSRPSAVDLCEAALRTAILDGVFAIGTRLPPERDLADRLGVNRVTVRSALQRLEVVRLVTVRQGSGYTVHDYPRHGGPDLLVALAERAEREGTLADFARDILCTRRHLARMVLEALAETVDERGRGEIGDAVARFADAVASKDPERIAVADIGVSHALVEGTRSPVLRLMLNPVIAVAPRIPTLRDAMYRKPKENLAGWQLLLAWLDRPTKRGIEALGEVLEARDQATVTLLRSHA